MLPKIELHLHLDCSLSYQVVHELRPEISRETYERDFIAPAKCFNLSDFLTRAVHGFELMQSENELRAVVADLFQQLANDGIIYAEIRFAPLLHLAKGLKSDEVVAIVNDATEKAIQETGIDARLLLCTLRHFSREQSLETVALAERFRGTKVVALDIAGDEAGYPIDNHVQAFELAQKYKLYRTAHAGEAKGPESVWESLRALAPSRVGHGVRSIEDPSLVAHLREQRIHLEICCSSNLQTNIYDKLQDHPIDRLYHAGISLSINTDARTITDITLEQEYEKLRDAFSWSRAHLLECNLQAIEAAFVSAETKRLLTDRLLQGFAAN
jgi:adenosine deaminase